MPIGVSSAGVDRSEAHQPEEGRRQQGGAGHRSARVLSECGVGHSERSGRETRKVLSVLC